MNPKRAVILDLPIELLESIFRSLTSADWKQLQLSCRAFHPIATSLCLENIRFTFNKDGVKGLVEKIESEQYICARTLTYIPKPAWPECSDYHMFCEVFEDPECGEIHAGGTNENDLEALKHYEDEQERKDAEQRDLFTEYQEEYDKARSQIQSLTSDLYFLKERSRSKQSPLQQFDDAMMKLKNLQEFVQEPQSQETDKWWRHLRLQESPDEDEDTEALHLALILRSLGLARIQTLRHMRFSIRGPAFWTPDRLRWLLRDGDHRQFRELRFPDFSVIDTENDTVAEEEGGDDDGIILQERRQFSDQLDIIWNSVLYVSSLDCSVSDNDFQDSLLSIAKPLSEFLSRAKDLEHLCLTFGTLVKGSPHYAFNYTDGPARLLALLTENKPWSNLHSLKLEIVTEEDTLLGFLASLSSTLRRLTLKCVTLAPHRGTWESTLAKMANVLPSVRLKLHFLCDYPLQEGINVSVVRILYREEVVWSDGDTSFSH